jgi:hypothetical protein
LKDDASFLRSVGSNRMAVVALFADVVDIF